MSIRPFLDSIRDVYTSYEILDKYKSSKVTSVAQRALNASDLNASALVADLVLHKYEMLPSDKNSLKCILYMDLTPQEKKQIFQCEILISTASPEQKQAFLTFLEEEIPERRRESFYYGFNRMTSVDLIEYILGLPREEGSLFCQYALPVIGNCEGGGFELITTLDPKDYCLLLNLRDNAGTVPYAIRDIAAIPAENKEIARQLAQAAFTSSSGIPYTELQNCHHWLQHTSPEDLIILRTQALPLIPFIRMPWSDLFSYLLAAHETIDDSIIPSIATLLEDTMKFPAAYKQTPFLQLLSFIPSSLYDNLIAFVRRSSDTDCKTPGLLLKKFCENAEVKDLVFSYIRSQLDTLLLPESINCRSPQTRKYIMQTILRDLPEDLLHEAFLLFSFHCSIDPTKKEPILHFLNTLSPKARALFGSLLFQNLYHIQFVLEAFFPLVLLMYRTREGDEFNGDSLEILPPFLQHLSSHRDDMDSIIDVIEQIPQEKRAGFIAYVTPLLGQLGYPHQNRVSIIRTAAVIPDNQSQRSAAVPYLVRLFGEGTTHGADVAEAIVNIPSENSRLTAIQQSFRIDSTNTLDGIQRARLIRICALPPVEREAALMAYLGHPPLPTFIYNAASEVLEVNRPDLQEHPEAYLKHIATEGFPSRIRFQGEEGIDAGGLSKQFSHDFCEALIKKDVFHLTEEGLPSLQEDKEKALFIEYGKFLSALRRKNIGKSDPILTGRVFSDILFEVLKVLTSSQEEQAKKQRAIVIMGKSSALGKTTYKPLLDYLEMADPKIEDNRVIQPTLESFSLIETATPSFTELKKACLEPFEAMYSSAYSAVQCIFEGLDADFKGFMARSDPKEVSNSIQGEAINNAKLADAIVTHTNDPVVITKVEWLKERINQESPASEWVKKFVLAVTGQTSIGPGFKINVQPTAEETVKSSTCFNNIYIPTTHNASFIDNPELTNKERFFAVVDLLINTTGYDRT